MTKHLVMIGGGHTHALVLKQWVMQGCVPPQVTLISDVWQTPYSGMLPGYLAGVYQWQDMHIDLLSLARCARINFVKAPVQSIDLSTRHIFVTDRPMGIHFDILSINCGSEPSLKHIPGASRWCCGVKPMAQFLDSWHRVKQQILQQGYGQIVIVGAGAAGVEVAFAMKEALGDQLDIILITREHNIVSTFPERAQEILAGLLKKQGVKLLTNTIIDKVENKQLYLKEGDCIHFDACFLCTHAAPKPFVEKSGLGTDEQGFIAVHPTLQSISHSFVFAAGDIATLVSQPTPKAGVYAVRQATTLAHNLLEAVHKTSRAQKLKKYQPQKKFLGLLKTCRNQALAVRGPFVYHGRIAWRLKHAIDSKFMKQFIDLSHQMQQEMNHQEMLCRGCAAKQSAQNLEMLFENLPTSYQTVIQQVLKEPDDAGTIKLPSSVQYLSQSTDYLPNLLMDPFVFGQIAVEHNFNDIFAMGLTPHSCLVNLAGPADSIDALRVLIGGILDRLHTHHVMCLGGHSYAHDELAVSLMVNAFSKNLPPWRKQGLQGHEKLILTKPLGVGLVFAASMRLITNSASVDHAIHSMLQSHAPVVLQSCEGFPLEAIHAVTDITGFGLAGHLHEMLVGTSYQAHVYCSKLPLLQGVGDYLQQGIVSSLFAANYQFLHGKVIMPQLWAPLLCDPQTSGPLLLAVHAEHAEDFVKKLKKSGFTAANIIGSIKPSQDNITIKFHD